MKFNKKLIVASLSTALGLGIVGSITGTVAWYSYNTRVTTSIIGVSTGNSGSVMFSLDGTNWTNRIFTNDILESVGVTSAESFDFEQVTFGQLDANKNFKNSPTETGYLQPEQGMGGYENWQKAKRNADYLQFHLYVKAEQDTGAGFTRVAKPIFLTDITLEDVGTTEVVDAFRIHIHDYNTPATNYLISKEAVTDLHLYSDELDLNDDGNIDKYGGEYEWVGNPDEPCMYGIENEVQSTYGVDEVVAGTNQGNIVDTSSTNPKLFKATTTTAGENLHFVITMWLEGWHELETNTPIWDILSTRGASFHVGLTFDAGLDVFD